MSDEFGPPNEERPLRGVKVRPRRPTSSSIAAPSSGVVPDRSPSDDAEPLSPANHSPDDLRRGPAPAHTGGAAALRAADDDLPPELRPGYVRPSKRRSQDDPPPVGTAPKPGDRSSMHDLLANLAERANEVQHITEESLSHAKRNPHEQLVGTTIDGKYLILSTIGRGGSGTVYKARHLVFENFVALKVLHPHLAADDRALRRFLHEARTVVKLRHPNAISVHDFGVVSGLPYLVMEHVEGKSLTQLILEVGPVPLERTSRILEQVCAALHSAHVLGIVHRDLKPDNIMVSTDASGNDFVRVLDFGIAKIVNDTSPEGARITRDGVPCGTPHYMSPEQVLGKSLDPRSDLYSLGIIIYEMLTGTPPFSEYSPIEVMFKQVHSVPPPPSEFKPELNIPANVEGIVARLLEKEPEARFQDAEELSQVFAAEVAAPSRGTLIPIRSRGRRWLRAPASGGARRSLVAEIIVLALIAALTTGIVLSIKYRRYVRAYLGAQALLVEQYVGFRIQPFRFVLGIEVDRTDQDLVKLVQESNFWDSKMLLEAGISPNLRDKSGRSLLHIAIDRSSSDVALELLRYHADPTSRTADGVTALMLAAIRDEVPLIYTLNQRGANVEDRDRQTKTALIHAIEHKNRAAVHALFVLEASVHAADGNGVSPLMYMIKSGMTDLIGEAIDRGAPVNARTKTNRTALWFAIEAGEVQALNLLLRHGADVKIHDADGETPLMSAAATGRPELVMPLVKAGADRAAVDANGKTALAYLPESASAELRAALAP